MCFEVQGREKTEELQSLVALFVLRCRLWSHEKLVTTSLNNRVGIIKSHASALVRCRARGKQEAGSRKQEAGSRKQEAGNYKDRTNDRQHLSQNASSQA